MTFWQYIKGDNPVLFIVANVIILSILLYSWYDQVYFMVGFMGLTFTTLWVASYIDWFRNKRHLKD